MGGISKLFSYWWPSIDWSGDNVLWEWKVSGLREREQIFWLKLLNNSCGRQCLYHIIPLVVNCVYLKSEIFKSKQRLPKKSTAHSLLLCFSWLKDFWSGGLSPPSTTNGAWYTMSCSGQLKCLALRPMHEVLWKTSWEMATGELMWVFIFPVVLMVLSKLGTWGRLLFKIMRHLCHFFISWRNITLYRLMAWTTLPGIFPHSLRPRLMLILSLQPTVVSMEEK